MAVQRRRTVLASLFICTAVIQACTATSRDDAPTAPPNTPALARATSGPAVTAASPAAARQGTVTLDVQITGSGFDAGSSAIWQLNGVPYSKIIVNTTTYVSPTSLIANITIAADAVPVTYDIAVVTGTGKKGIGAEMFTVTYAVAIPGLTEGRAINDAGQVIGANGSTVVLSDPGAGVVQIAANALAYDIDRNGRTVVGKDADGDAVIWSSATGPSGPWLVTKLPATGDGTVRGIASDASGDAVMVSGAMFSASMQRVPTVWTRTTSGWQSAPLGLAGLAGAWGEDINVRGQVVGMDGSGCCTAIYWDSLGMPTPLGRLGGARNAAAWAINGDGTIIVGVSGTTAVLWRRSLTAGTYGPWSGAIALESTSTLCGKNGSSAAYDVNAAGTIVVGESCGVAVAWRLDAGTVAQRLLLQGLGPPNQSVAYGINDAAFPYATGTAKTTIGVLFLGF